MTNKYFICDVENLSETGSRGFDVDFDGDTITGFIVHKEGRYYAYRNSCPHTGAPLDWLEHQFLDMDGELIQCAVHDARFVIEDGKCIAGPCAGQFLQPLNIILRENKVFLLKP